MKSVSFDWPVIGHESILEYLQRGIKNHSLAHGFIFSGPEGVGKKTTLKYFLTSLFCQAQDKLPCLSCPTCQQVSKQVLPDITWVEPELDAKTGNLKKNISIEQVKGLKEKLSRYSFHPSYKVAVINQAESLSLEAANSLLKLLEEPSGQTVITLVTHDAKVLLPTIISRCQVLHFRPVASGTVKSWLVHQGASKSLAETVTPLASGRPGLAKKYVQDSHLLKSVQASALEFIEILDQPYSRRFVYVSQLLRESGKNYTVKARQAHSILNAWQLVLRDVLIFKLQGTKYLRHYGLRNSLQKLGAQTTPLKLSQKIEILEGFKRQLQSNTNPQLILENSIINLP